MGEVADRFLGIRFDPDVFRQELSRVSSRDNDKLLDALLVRGASKTMATGLLGTSRRRYLVRRAAVSPISNMGKMGKTGKEEPTVKDYEEVVYEYEKRRKTGATFLLAQDYIGLYDHFNGRLSMDFLYTTVNDESASRGKQKRLSRKGSG